MSQQADMLPSDTLPEIEDWNAGLPDGTTYMLDAMHFPYPMSPLSLSIVADAWVDGATRGFQEAGIPLRRFHSIWRNSYQFQRMEMEEFANEDEARRRGQAIEAAMREQMGRLLERWETDQLPAARSYLATLRSLRDRVASSDRVLQLLDEALAAFAELWRIHFTVVIPMGAAMQVFDEFHVDVFGGSEEDGHALLAGQLNESVKAGFGLSDLAHLARSLELEDIITGFEPDDALAKLADTGNGRAFLAALAEYLDVYGIRQDLFDVEIVFFLEEAGIRAHP